MMDIIYFSPCYNSERIANKLGEILGEYTECNLIDCTQNSATITGNESLLLVAPIYDNGLPRLLASRLESIKYEYKNILIVLTYGGVSVGNSFIVVQELFREGRVHGAMLIKTPHCYLKSSSKIALSDNLITAMREFAKCGMDNYRSDIAVTFGKRKSEPFAKYMDKRRAKLFPPPYTDYDSCRRCSECVIQCPTLSITDDYLTGEDCIHCNRCVKICASKSRKVNTSILPRVGIKLASTFARKYRIIVK